MQVDAEPLAQSNAKPAAWRYLVRGIWSVTNIKGAAEFWQSEGCVVEPLYTTLAQSDAEPMPDDNFERHLQARISKLEHEIAELTSNASAGLIEAAEWHEEQAFEWAEIMIKCRPDRVDECKAKQELHFYCARELRSRAADRSGK